MKLIKRFLVVFILILAAALLTLYFFMDAILESAARQGVIFAAKNLASEGIELIDPTFERIIVSIPPALSIKNFSARMMVMQKSSFQIAKDFLITIQRAGISLRGIAKGEFVFTVEDAVVVMRPELASQYDSVKGMSSRDKLTIRYIVLPFQVNIFDPKYAITQASYIFKGLARFAKYGVTDLPMDMAGYSEFTVGDKFVKGKLFLNRYGKEKKLAMDAKDFQNIADTLGEKLTQYEFVIYCNNPLRMPRMLRIRNYASDKAREAYSIDSKVPEDAYKHVLWAYLLALAYDEKFSRETTDSHELDPVGRTELSARIYLAAERNQKNPAAAALDKKTEAETQMDLINNAIGRKYARRGYPESGILELMTSDPDVVRDVSELGLGKGEDTEISTAQ